MRRFSTDKLHLVKDTSNYFWLEEGFEYVTHIKLGIGSSFASVPLANNWVGPYSTLWIAPFKTDLASVPWYIQWRLKKYGVYDFAAIPHDYLLQHREQFPELSRKQIDQIFREAMIDLGVPERECNLMYYGVRLNSYWKEERFYG